MSGPDLALAGLAAGLARGTKLTAFFALPCLALIALASSIAGFAAVGSCAYARNVFDSGQVFGSLAGDPGLQRPEITATGTVSTVARYLHHMIDLSGFPLGISDLRPIATVARAAFLALQIPQNPPESAGYPFGFALNVRANEDLSFFGPLGVLLVLPLSVAFLVLAARRRATLAQAAHAAALPLYLTALALGYRYSGQGRFLITPVVLSTTRTTPSTDRVSAVGSSRCLPTTCSAPRAGRVCAGSTSGGWHACPSERRAGGSSR